MWLFTSWQRLRDGKIFHRFCSGSTGYQLISSLIQSADPLNAYGQESHALGTACLHSSGEPFLRGFIAWREIVFWQGREVAVPWGCGMTFLMNSSSPMSSSSPKNRRKVLLAHLDQHNVIRSDPVPASGKLTSRTGRHASLPPAITIQMHTVSESGGSA